MPDIAFFQPEADGVYVPTQFSRSLWAPGTLNGPAVCGLAAHTAEQELDLPGFRPARLTVDLFKAAKELPTTTHCRILRDGRRITVAEISVRQHAGDTDDAVEVARATAVFLRESTDPRGERWSRPSAHTPFDAPRLGADDLMPRFSTDHPEDAGSPDWTTDMGAIQNGHRKRIWTRAAPVVAGSPLTPFQRAVIGAESASLVGNWGSTGIGFINCDLTVALSRMPVGERIGVEADSHTEDDGISVSTAGLYDCEGMFGVGTVTAVNNAAAQIDFTSVDTHGRYREA